MPASRSFTFAATMRMVYRVHHYAAHRGTNSTPTLRARFTDRLQIVLFVANLADCGAAVYVDLANLAGTQTELRIIALSGQKLHRSTRRPSQLSAFSGHH